MGTIHALSRNPQWHQLPAKASQARRRSGLLMHVILRRNAGTEAQPIPGPQLLGNLAGEALICAGPGQHAGLTLKIPWWCRGLYPEWKRYINMHRR
jgi:hypothetical protein